MSFDNIFEFFTKVPSLKFSLSDFLDIALVAFVIYYAIKLIRETRAFQLLKGLVLLGALYLVVFLLDMQASTYMFRFIFKNIFIVLVIVFQSEIRSLLERVGRSKISFRQLISGVESSEDETQKNAIIEICKAVQRMSDSKTGALIVMEKDDIIETENKGINVDASISHELIGNVFFPNSPLHDGAAIVSKGRLVRAGCVLPLTGNDDLSSDLGTRHRAALGMSERCDCVVIVVSEETGTISLARGGKLSRDYSESDLRAELFDYLLDDMSTNGGDEGFSLKKVFKRFKR